MVRHVFNLMYREVKGLHQAAYVLALFAFGSQLLALLRDRMLAAEFGAGAELDIYYAAFRIPDVLFVLFASTLSVYVLIPFVARAKEQYDAEHARLLLGQVFTIFCGTYVVLAITAIIVAPSIAAWLFPGIENQELLVAVMRVLLLQPLFLGISSLFGVVTQLHHRFVLYAISPLLYNLGIIVGIIALYPLFGLVGIAFGVVLGAVGHLAVQWPLVRSSELAFGFVRQFDWRELRSVLAVSVPRALTLSVHHIVLLVLVGIASTMVAGSVSVFQFAFNLQSVPLAIIGVSYSVAAFPVLAQLFAAKDNERFTSHITTALRHIIFWAVPVTVLIIVLRAQLVRVVLGSGSFDWNDTRLTAAVLAILVVALVAYAINLLLIRAFYAGGNTRLPLIISLVTGTAAVISAWGATLFYVNHPALQVAVATFLRVPDVVGSEVVALAFAYAGTMIIESILLLYFATRAFSLSLRWLPRMCFEAGVAALVGGTAAYATLNFVVEGLNTETFIGIFLQGALAGLCGVAGVVLGYWLMRSPELREVTRSFQKRIFKTDVVAPQADVL